MAILRALIVMAALLQSVSTPIRIGDFAKKLTSQEVLELERIAAAGGAKGAPWLLEGPIGQLSSSSIRIYLPAEKQTSELRRGSAIELTRRPGQTAWTPLKTVQYAQTLKVGQDVNSIKGDQRPFTVSGSFSDAELVEIVKLVRRSEGGAPILSLSLTGTEGDSATVLLSFTVNKIRILSLTRKASSWKVKSASTAIP
jgi:hypothetical protein